MAIRNYSSTTPIVTITSAGGISAGDVTVTLSNTEDVFPAVPFTLILAPDTVNEEVVEVTDKNGTFNFFTITRGVDGTTARAHASGVQAIHGVSGRDFQESVQSTTVTAIVALTQAQYDALPAPDATTLYVING